MNPPSVVDRSAAVLVLIDLQERLAAVMGRRAAVVETAVLLAGVARELAMPVIVTRQYPEGLGDLVPELSSAALEGDPVDKLSFCCTKEPAFGERLADTRRSQVVLAGIETHICVAQTALALRGSGHDVFVVADATCSRRDEDHAVALDRMRAAGVTVTTAESVIYEALGRAGTPEFAAVLTLVKGRAAR